MDIIGETTGGQWSLKLYKKRIKKFFWVFTESRALDYLSLREIGMDYLSFLTTFLRFLC